MTLPNYIEAIKHMFGKKIRRIHRPHGKRLRRTITLSEHSCWGDSIGWFDWNKRLLSGHMGGRNMPEVGDIIRTNLDSGKIGVLRVIEVTPCDNPKDQFFAAAEDIGYEEDDKTA